MLDPRTREQIVADLEAVYSDRKPLPLLTRTHPAIEIEDAYRIQEAFVARRVAAGERIRGWKVGLTSKPMQDMMGASEPDFSAITGDLFLAEGGSVPADRFLSPLVEIEIAFVMKSALKGPGVLTMDVLRATDFVVPAIEIVDFRVERAPGMTIVDTVADLAACGAVVLGANPRRLEDIDVRTVNGELLRNGESLAKGQSSAVLGNPVNAVAWLANKLGEFGVTFEPGAVILSGSFTRAFPVGPGQQVIARYDQGLGDVVIDFA